VKNAFAVNFGKNKYEGPTQWTEDMGLFWTLKARDIEGKEFDFEELKGHVCLVINVACKCVFPKSSYNELEKLSEKYWDQGLRVLCFPSNQFLNQEPWTEAEIKEWVFKNWPKLQIQMFSKIDVNGPETHPVYLWLKKSAPGDIVWNFSTKFLVGADGKPIKRFEKNQPWTEIEEAIKHELTLAKPSDENATEKVTTKSEDKDEHPVNEQMTSAATEETKIDETV